MSFLFGMRDISILIGLTKSVEHEANCTHLHEKHNIVAGNVLGKKKKKTAKNCVTHCVITESVF